MVGNEFIAISVFKMFTNSVYNDIHYICIASGEHL